MMYERHGTIIERMRLQPDFRIFKLKPHSGRFIVGFGAAYEIHGEYFDQLKHLNAGGINPHASRNHLAREGHGRDERSSKRLPARPRGSLNESMKNMLVNNMNEHHQEALINIANSYADYGTVIEAEMMTIDTKGIGLRIATVDGSQDVRIEFETAVKDAEHALSTLMNMSIHARNLSDD
jgi:putative heme iron utilization protein